MRSKISVIGSGYVGATTASYLAQKELGSIVITDIIDGLPQGTALDLFESSPVLSFDATIKGTIDYADIADSNIVVITAGLPRKPNMDRLDLLKVNGNIVKGIADNIVKYAPNAIVLVVSNPIDIMVYLTYKRTGFPKNRVIGMAGILDTARLESFIAMELDISVKRINATILGGHGDQMIPIPRYTTVNGIPITELLSKETIEKINNRARNGGAEIVSLLKRGSAYFAPAASVCSMVEPIVKDQRNIILSSCLLEGEYGISDCYLGVPAILGTRGIERIVEINLTDSELKQLRTNAGIYKDSIAELKQEEGFEFL